MYTMYFNIFSKDPKSPWSNRTSLSRGRLRYGTAMTIVLSFTLAWGVYQSYTDATFIKGSGQTTAQFVNILKKTTDSRQNTTYYGSYVYQVDGQQYQVTAAQSSSSFKRTATVVYKRAQPSDAEVLYRKTPAQAVLWDIGITLAACLFLYFLLYGVALLG